MKSIREHLEDKWDLSHLQKAFPSFFDHVHNCPIRFSKKIKVRELKPEHIKWFVECVDMGPLGTLLWLEKTFQIRKQTILKWKKIIHRNGRIQNLKGGRPRLIDDEEKARLAQYLSAPGYKVKADSTYLKLLNNAIKETTIKRTGLPREYVVLDDTRVQASPTYIRSLESELKIGTPTANYTTKARAEACASVRNGMSFSSALYTLLGPNSDRINPMLIINVDGTVFSCPLADITAKIKVIRRDGVKEEFKVAPDVEDNDTENGKVGGCGIKFYPFITAAGKYCSYIIQYYY